MEIIQKEIDRILDFLDNNNNIDDKEMMALLDTEEGQKAWSDIKDLDEAANRAKGRQPDVDSGFETHLALTLGKQQVGAVGLAVGIQLSFKSHSRRYAISPVSR